MPDSYRVTLSKLELNEQIQEQIKEITGSDLDEIRSSNETISIIMNIGNGIRIFTFGLLIILILFAIVIIVYLFFAIFFNFLKYYKFNTLFIG